MNYLKIRQKKSQEGRKTERKDSNKSANYKFGKFKTPIEAN